MKKETVKISVADRLRMKAEKNLKSRKLIMDHMSDIDVRKLAHELEVHQIEIEMQNEELRRTQEELESSRANYADLYDFAPVGYFTFDKSGIIVNVNLTGAEQLGTERSRLIQKPFSQFIQRESQEVFYLHRRKVLDNPDRQSCKIKLQKSSGPELYVQLESIPFKDSKGDTFIRTSLIDITDRMKAEEDRHQMLIELARKNVDLEQLMYITSHDLRTPLVNIEGYSRELSLSLNDLLSAVEAEEAPLSIKNIILPRVRGEIAESVKVIHTSVSKMSALISGILKFSRIGKKTLTIEDIDMDALMGDVIENFKFILNESCAAIEVSRLVPCRGDPDQLNQLFSNLIDNAMKYRDPNRPCMIRISGHREKEYAIYCVEDNGIGIGPEHCESIFEIFNKGRHTQPGGEGLGLTIAQRIVVVHKGDIRVESEKGKGSTFFVSLPA